MYPNSVEIEDNFITDRLPNEFKLTSGSILHGISLKILLSIGLVIFKFV